MRDVGRSQRLLRIYRGIRYNPSTIILFRDALVVIPELECIFARSTFFLYDRFFGVRTLIHVHNMRIPIDETELFTKAFLSDYLVDGGYSLAR